MSLTQTLRDARWNVQKWLMQSAGVRVERATPRVKREDERHRYAYQRRHVNFDIAPGSRVLDVGSGGDPFPHATVLLDRFTGQTQHRHAPLIRDGREFVEGDIMAMPFADGEFDFAYCAHVLEHLDDPLGACRELMRVARRGYIETPTLGKDMLFAWNVRDMHRWHLVAIANRLCFFELTPRQNEGIRSKEWQKLIFGPWEHPLQDAYFDNADLFNVMFLWQGSFAVQVFRLDGSVQSLAPSSSEATSTCETSR